MEKTFATHAIDLALRMERAYLSTRLAVQDGRFTFLPCERPTASLQLNGRATDVQVISLEFGDDYCDDRTYLKCETAGGDFPVLSEDLFFAGELVRVADAIPLEAIDYDDVEPEWEVLKGTYEIGGGSAPVVIDADHHIIRPEDSGQGLMGTEAYLEIRRIKQAVDAGNDLVAVLKKLSDNKGFDLPF